MSFVPSDRAMGPSRPTRPPLDTPEQIARGTVLLLLARIGFFACGLGTSILLARILGPAEFGTYGLVFSLVTWLQVVLTGGVSGATAKLVAENPDRRAAVEQTALLLVTVCGGFFLLLGFAASEPIARFFGLASLGPALRIALFDLPLMALVGAWQGTLYASARYGLLALGIALHGLLKVGGMAVLAAHDLLSVESAFLVHLVSSLGVFVFLLLRFPPRPARPAGDLAKALLERALPLSVYYTAGQLHANFPLWILAAVASSRASSGAFVAALNISRTLTLVPSVLSGIVFGAVSRAAALSEEAQAREHLAAALRLALLMVAPAVVLVGVAAEPLVSFLFGPGYREAASILRWQMAAFSLFALVDVLFHALFAFGIAALPSRLFAGLLVPAMPLLVLFVARFGAEGAAVGHALLMALALAAASFLTVRRFGSIARLASVARIAAAAGLAGILVSALPAAGGWVVPGLFLGSGLYLILLVLSRELGTADLALVPLPLSVSTRSRGADGAALVSPQPSRFPDESRPRILRERTNPIRLGIMLQSLDSTWGGIGIYTEELVKNLLSIDRTNEYVLFYPRFGAAARRCGTFARAYPNVREVVTEESLLPTGTWWDQVTVAPLAREYALDIIFNPFWTTPILAPCKKLMTIHAVERCGINKLVKRNYNLRLRIDWFLHDEFFMRWCDGLISISAFMTEALTSRYGIPPERVRTIHHGLSARFRPVEDPARKRALVDRLGLPERFVLFVGHIYPQKNFGNLVRALKLLENEVPHELVVAGSTRWHHEEDVALVHELGLTERVRFLGFVSHDDLPTLYSLADCFVFPSFYEAFGLAAVEAMACGCPVAAANAAALPEVTAGAAVLFDPHRPESIARALLALLTDEELRRACIARGLARARHFSWERCARETLAFMTDLVHG
ncbi:MAG: glycosyltransferase [Geminicoccaceae bacterium]|nr:glycosyltransferase [Geminicoccaceae bacterium]